MTSMVDPDLGVHEESFDVLGACIVLDTTRAAVASIQIDDRRFLAPEEAGSLLRLAVPIEGYAAHWVDCTMATPHLERDEAVLQVEYDELRSAHLALDVNVKMTISATDDGLVVRCTVLNNSDFDIPQVVFPRLLGLQPARPGAPTRLQLPGRTMRPFEELSMDPDDCSMLDIPLQEYIYYGSLDMTMKWLDYGDQAAGLTLYSRSPRYTTQGILVQRRDRGSEIVDLQWVHYPSIAPGQAWDSDEFVLLPHTGDWYVGARSYQQFVGPRYPYRAPKRIREALAIRSLWPAVRNSTVTFRFDELPEYVAEVADPDLGIGEVVLWHWWLKNGYPMIVDDRLGSEDDLRSALSRCRDLGVPVSLFVSHHILRDSDETDSSWLHRTAAGQSVVWNWTYSSDYVPKFGVPFAGTHSMVRGSALSKGWRETGLREYSRIMDLGAESICFDVFYAWSDPNYSPDADGAPDEEGERLLEFAGEARAIVHAARPEGTFSGEWPSDLKVPWIDYTWDWRNATDVANCAPFRYVFPQFRLNANVGGHPRGPILAFMEGALINVMPGNLQTERLADHPDLVKLLRELNQLRRRFLRFFTEGQYHHLEGATVESGQGRVYVVDDEVLVVLTNPSDDEREVHVRIDTAVVGLGEGPWRLSAHQLSGAHLERGTILGPLAVSEVLPPDGLLLLHLRRPGGTGGKVS